MNATNFTDVDKLVNSFQYPFTKVYMSFDSLIPLNGVYLCVYKEYCPKKLKRQILEESSEGETFESFTFNALKGISEQGFCILHEYVPPAWAYYSTSEGDFDFNLHSNRISQFVKKQPRDAFDALMEGMTLSVAKWAVPN